MGHDLELTREGIDIRDWRGRCVRCGREVCGIEGCPSKNNHDCLCGYYDREFRLAGVNVDDQYVRQSE